MEGADIDAASDEEEEPSDEVEEPSQSEDSQEEEDDKDGKAGGVEDRFLKINDLEKFLEEAEHQSFEPSNAEGENTDDDDEDEDEVEDEGDDMGEEETGDDSEKGAQHEKSAKRPRYEDFFGGKKKAKLKRSSASLSESDDMESGDDNNSDDEHDEKQPKEKPSKHERQMEKIHKKMKELEKANLETKSWTMQGEVTAAKRPKNSALEVELEFEHNMRPAPVITEEVTASLEDIIKHRIVEEHFDDVQRKPALPSTAPKERIELDENKSERGLAEIYESEYMQKTGLAAAPTSSSDALKKEAALLFKRLCVKLDALSHFQFTPKPVIEDMSIQANVPALAMEEVAPMAVSEASMLAPEELFSGEGVVKEEGELTREDRKRLRAKKKRKLRAENSNKEIKKKRQLQSKDEEHGDQERRPKQQKRAQTHYGKSSKVFADLDLAMVKGSTKLSQKKTDVRNPSFLKL
uniref:TSA: Wollemia nobilis Ref_Wollemi_Transcript_8009_1601 transcribed RNA sequence n=1 Tax=Wollemia nobilis TaxID=56998 RepID=A0A0C9RNM7_9CONI